ncbi:MAG: hypothetical protein V4795_10180 [Pseudomonadota bacterium]
MATTRFASQLALELDGQVAASLRRCQPASLRVEPAPAGPEPEAVLRPGVRVTLGEMAAELDLVEPGPLLDWLQATLAGEPQARSGAVVVADHNLTVQRRIGFSGAWLSALAWPVLDAAVPRNPFTLGLRWLAGQVDEGSAGDKLQAKTTRRKLMQTNNFRVLGMPFGGKAVGRVLLPAVSVPQVADSTGSHRDPRPQPGLRRLDELALGIDAREAAAARKWVRQLVADGQVDAGEGLDLQVEMLDAALKKVMASIRLDGCLLRGMDDDLLGGGSDRAPGVTLRFAVAGMALKMA